MLRVEDLVAVIRMERSIGPKPCGCSPSRDCAHDPPEPRPAPAAARPVRCAIDAATGEPLYSRYADCQHGVADDEVCGLCNPPEVP